MNRLRLTPLPTALLAAWAVVGAAIVAIGLTTTDPRLEAQDDLALVAVTIMFMTWGFIGALVASRHPRNTTGWLLLGLAGVLGVGILGDVWGSAVTGSGSPLPGRVYAGWVGHLLGQNAALFGLIAIVLLVFPTGQPPSPRWRTGVGFLVVTGAVYTVLVAVRPGLLAEVSPPTSNPFAIDAVGTVWPHVDNVVGPAFLLAGPVSIVGVVMRFRRSHGVERQQLKWLLVGAVGMVALLASGPALFWRIESLQAAWTIAFVAGMVVLPVAVGVAMLRHGLYEIDRIISRTATYAIVAALLGGVYVGATLLATSLLRPVTGSSDLPVALATLLVAAAIRPVHARVRTIVERRFHRRRYDAQVAVEGFGHGLRDQLDVADIERSITSLVRVTFQPDTLSLWVADGASTDVGTTRPRPSPARAGTAPDGPS